MAPAWPVVVIVRQGNLVAVEQEAPVVEPSVVEPAADASILLAVPVAVIVVVVVAVVAVVAAAAAASSTPAAVLPTQPALEINMFVILETASTRTCMASC